LHLLTIKLYLRILHVYRTCISYICDPIFIASTANL